MRSSLQPGQRPHSLSGDGDHLWVTAPEPCSGSGKGSSQLCSPLPHVPERLTSSRPQCALMFAIAYVAALGDPAQPAPIMALTCDDRK